eukprot:GHUV01001112.1.p1 GENE.GHUV01001112.1~~GHUV01001112.1.p1  ORF type:complete len:580 (+),score=160.69 GHUV01001112.1:58-1797(+)
MGQMRGLPVLLLLSILLAGASLGHASLIRGAIPDQIERYQPINGKFKCFDGSKEIDYNQVNDNFCDCPDSSDEPGTSACPNGEFYCRNKGHEPKLLSTSFVDDGICDCCDGSDELSGCKNTCIEKNSAKRDALKKKIDEYKASLEKKAQYAASAAGVREHIKQRHQNVDGDIANTEEELAKLTAGRKRVEEETEVKRAEHKKQQAELAAQRKAAAEAKAAEDAKAAADREATDAAAAAGVVDQAGDGAAQQDGDQPEQAAGEQEETEEERGRRIAAQWTNDPAAAGPAGSDSSHTDSAATSEHAEDVTEQLTKDDGNWLSGIWKKAADSVKKVIAPEEQPGTPDEPQEDSATEYNGHTAEYDRADEEDLNANAPDVAHDADYEPFDDSDLRNLIRDQEAAERKLAELRSEKERVTRQANVTFNDAWAGLINKCLESRTPQFTYKFCFFDKASQVDNGGGHETSLGYWKGFENAGTEAVFDGGDYCHKAPPRSLRVMLQCGSEERAWDASEPEVCSYVVHASTPAACKQEKLKELESTLQALLDEEAALAAEIAAEEQQRQTELAVLRDKIEGAGLHDEL